MMTAFVNIPDLGCGKVQRNGGLRPAYRVAQKAGDIADAGLRLVDSCGRCRERISPGIRPNGAPQGRDHFCDEFAGRTLGSEGHVRIMRLHRHRNKHHTTSRFQDQRDV